MNQRLLFLVKKKKVDVKIGLLLKSIYCMILEHFVNIAQII